MRQGTVTTYDRDGNVLSHSEGETEMAVPLHRDPQVFRAFLQAQREGENVLAIAERFDTDHCTVLYWKRRLGLSDPNIGSWPGVEE
jgi:hypothetical protein